MFIFFAHNKLRENPSFHYKITYLNVHVTVKILKRKFELQNIKNYVIPIILNGLLQSTSGNVCTYLFKQNFKRKFQSHHSMNVKGNVPYTNKQARQGILSIIIVSSSVLQTDTNITRTWFSISRCIVIISSMKCETVHPSSVDKLIILIINQQWMLVW